MVDGDIAEVVAMLAQAGSWWRLPKNGMTIRNFKYLENLNEKDWKSN